MTLASAVREAFLSFPMIARLLMSQAMNMTLACLPVWPAALVWKVPFALLVGASTYAVASVVLDRVELGVRQKQLAELLHAGE